MTTYVDVGGLDECFPTVRGRPTTAVCGTNRGRPWRMTRTGTLFSTRMPCCFAASTAGTCRIVARELSRPIKLLIASQPTRGLDVGSIEYIHGQILKRRDEGIGVLLVSTELDEILQLSDRIAVMYRGKVVAIVPAEQATKEYLGLLMAGIQPEQAKEQAKAQPIDL